jgi:hypothetical protein
MWEMSGEVLPRDLRMLSLEQEENVTVGQLVGGK